MNPDMMNYFKLYMLAIPLLAFAGIYCVVMTRNLIRVLIGLEILTKAVTLLIIVGGRVTGHLAQAQAMVITLIVVEVVVMVVAAGVILNVFRHNNSLDTRHLKELKG